MLDLVGGQDVSKVQETMVGELKVRRYIVASIDQAQQPWHSVLGSCQNEPEMYDSDRRKSMGQAIIVPGDKRLSSQPDFFIELHDKGRRCSQEDPDR